MTGEDLGRSAKDEYDRISAVYEAITDDNLANAHFERPVLRSLLPPVDGKRVLDAGCAAGHHSEWLADRGAVVTAVDLSPRMVERRFGLAGYYETGIVEDHWESFGATLRFRRRTMEEIMRALEDAGFLIRRYREPRPEPIEVERHPADDPEWPTRPTFLFLEAVRG